MPAVGRLSTRLSSSAWVSASIQCRSSKTSEQRLHLALAQQQALDRSSVRWRRCGGSSACHAGSSTGTSSSARRAGSVGSSARSRVSSLPVTFSRIARWVVAVARSGSRLLSRSMTGR